MRFSSCSRSRSSWWLTSEMMSKKCLNHGTSPTYYLVLLRSSSPRMILWRYRQRPRLQSALNHRWTEILRTWIWRRKISGQMPVTWFSLSRPGIQLRDKTWTSIPKVPSLAHSLVRSGPPGTCRRASVRILAKYHQADWWWAREIACQSRSRASPRTSVHASSEVEAREEKKSWMRKRTRVIREEVQAAGTGHKNNDLSMVYSSSFPKPKSKVTSTTKMRMN